MPGLMLIGFSWLSFGHTPSSKPVPGLGMLHSGFQDWFTGHIQSEGKGSVLLKLRGRWRERNNGPPKESQDDVTIRGGHGLWASRNDRRFFISSLLSWSFSRPAVFLLDCPLLSLFCWGGGFGVSPCLGGLVSFLHIHLNSVS